MSDMLRELYQEVIIDHNRNPHNYRNMPEANYHADGYNPLCGDKVHLYLKVENEVIQDAAFQGEGCAISTASASIMTDLLRGKSIAQAKQLFEDFHDLVTDKQVADIEQLGKLAVLAGVKDYPVRVKCATLAWHTFLAALQNKSTPASTE
jgi:nitrogen fixation NifU-like protein